MEERKMTKYVVLYRGQGGHGHRIIEADDVQVWQGHWVFYKDTPVEGFELMDVTKARDISFAPVSRLRMIEAISTYVVKSVVRLEDD